MKYYLLIVGDDCYPKAGTRDWVDTFHSYEDAESAMNLIKEGKYLSKNIKYEASTWFEIVDLREWINK